MKYKIKLTLYLEIDSTNRPANHVDLFCQGSVGQNLMTGGPLVVTAAGVEDCGILSAYIIKAERIIKRNIKAKCELCGGDLVSNTFSGDYCPDCVEV